MIDAVKAGVDLDVLHQRALDVPMQKVAWPALNQNGLELIVRRDDLIDPHQSGNKFYKLFYNLCAANERDVNQLLSFGGAYSNHLYALAAAGHAAGIRTVGVVRGERPTQLSPTLRDAEAWDMQLCFVPRAEYRSDNDELLNQLRERYGDFLLVPEGGANLNGARGAAVMGWAITQQLGDAFDVVCVPCGTGSTLAGLASALPNDKTAIGFSVLKGDGTLGRDINHLYRCCLSPSADATSGGRWRLISGYHTGGYARKLPPRVNDFWRDFEAETGILLDPVYSLKMFWGIACLAAQDYWAPGTRLVVVHTGGLQGRRGFQSQLV